jgi:hypothetical protein
MKVRFVERYTLALVKRHPDEIFVFGDNMAGWGKKIGQAIIRPMPNAFGVPTKREPARYEAAYFSDQPDEFAAIHKSLQKLYRLSRTHTLVFPLGGLGTGLAEMQVRSPQAWKYMNQILKDHFGVVNGLVSRHADPKPEVSPEP